MTAQDMYYEYIIPQKVVNAFDRAMLDYPYARSTKRYSIDWSKIVFSMLMFDVFSTLVVLMFVAWLVLR